MKIALVTDSNSQIPAALAQRYDVRVVPITVALDGVEYAEGVTLDADEFYRRLAAADPEVTTSQPSPGVFAAVYQQLADEGADAIVSIHVALTFSGTLNSAAVAAGLVDIPVRLVDSRTTSFGVACCVWRAGEARAAGGDADAIVAAAESTAATTRSVTVLQALDVVRLRQRVGAEFSPTGDAIDVILAGPDGSFDVIGSSRSVDELCDIMANAMHCDGAPMRAAVCIADAAAAPFWQGLEHRLSQRRDVVDLVRYRVGPSVGAYTGPGAAGGFWFPV